MESKSAVNIEGLDFAWEPEKGLFTFEGDDAVLFWISSAMKEFFDALEEVSGEEAAKVVMQTTGFRQGIVVGEYFTSMENVTIEQASKLITATYATAGWGLAEIFNLNLEEQTLSVSLKNSWEHKMNVSQKKETGGDFLPAHYAGIFTGLLNTNMWYKVEHYQIEGYDETIIRFFPSEETVDKNIHRLARSEESRQIMRLEKLVAEKTAGLHELIKEISSPIIPVLDGIVVIPLLGTYDEERTEELLQKTLQNLPEHKAKYVVLDLTGLNNRFTEHAASLIDKLGATASLIGTETILVGISPSVSITITKSGMDLSKFNCFQTLKHGMHFALAQSGRTIV